MARRKAAQAPRRFTGEHHTLGSTNGDPAQTSAGDAPPTAPAGDLAAALADEPVTPPPAKRRRLRQPAAVKEPRLQRLLAGPPPESSRPLASLQLRPPPSGDSGFQGSMLCVALGSGDHANGRAGSVWQGSNAQQPSDTRVDVSEVVDGLEGCAWMLLTACLTAV